MRVLNAMDRPQDLFDAIEHDAVARFFAGMICRKTAVIGWMPIFRGEDEIESLLQFISNRNDFITMRHRQRAARQKIVLKIDNDQGVHLVCAPCYGLVRLSPSRKGERIKVRGFQHAGLAMRTLTLPSPLPRERREMALDE